jgi:Flp pilus assembly protein TadG
VHLRDCLRVFRQRLRRNAKSGAVSIEFALIAPVFFLLLMGIMEVGVIFYAQNSLEFATQEAARLILTGAAQDTAYATASKCSGSRVSGSYTSSQQWFTDQVCCGISGIMNCNNLQVDVESYSSGFSNASYSNPLTAQGTIAAGNNNYSPGNPCDVVLVRSFYTWPVITPGLSAFLVNMANNNHLLVATSAFRNEPYTSASGGC